MDPKRRNILIGVLATVLAAGVIVLVLTRRGPDVTAPQTTASAPTESASPTPTSESPSSTAPISSATTETTPTGKRDSQTPTAVPGHTYNKDAYCQAYADILAAAPKETDPTGDPDSAGPDLKKLSRTYGKLIKLYTATAKTAPDEVAGDYAKVLQYLKDVKATVDSGDLKAVRAQFRQMSKLNEAMDKIETKTKQICG